MKTGTFFRTLFIAFTAALLFPGAAAVRADEDPAQPVMPEAQPQAVCESEEAFPDPAMLLSGYLENGPGGGVSRRAASPPDALLGINREIFDQLVSVSRAIASGDRFETEICIDLSAWVEGLRSSGARMTWSASDLGLDSLTDEDNYVSREAERAFADAIGFNARSIVHSLILYCPYECYWRGLDYSYYYPYETVLENGEAVLTYSEEFQIWISVSVDYAAFLREYDGTCDEENEQTAVISIPSEDGSIREAACVFSRYTTDPGKISSVNSAIENAAAIVSEAAAEGLDDIGKLCFYRDRIHSLASFNSSAAYGGYYSDYGDPWQIIYVFDGDPGTNVVCEGFAKSFQYLCDRTAFDRGDLFCISVSGYLENAGLHMWNIVSISGKNYFADLTNDSPSADLFLEGALSGSVYEGYVFSESFGYVYSYDDETAAVYSEDMLAIDPGTVSEAPVLSGVKNTGTGITVTWEPSANADGYFVWRKDESSGYALLARIDGGENRSYTDTGVSSGEMYNYIVSSFGYDEVLDEERAGQSSDALSIFCIRRPAITGFTSKAPGFVLVWTEIPEADGYIIYRKAESGSYERLKKLRSGTVTTWTDTTVREGTMYSYKVSAYRILGGSAYKSCVSAEKTKYRLDPPAAPSVRKGNGFIQVRWNAVNAADGYIIYKKTESGELVPVKTIEGNTAVSWNDASPEIGKTHYYKVKAYKTFGDKTYYSLCSPAASLQY